MHANFRHIDLRLIDPPFGSNLNTLILELDYLRRKPLGGTTHPGIFSQLKEIFHTLESIGSARIEGNRTTIAEYVERKIEGRKTKEEKFLEIENNENALDFIEKNIENSEINRLFLSELHKIITQNLTPPPQGEGSRNPGDYRKNNVTIAHSSHLPPDASTVPAYMDELFDFINRQDPPQYDLLKVALAHHRFAWIHPFDNGNGRVVRLLTYAMLIKYGFKVNIGGRIINPTAVFCSDREKYYHFLSIADQGDDKSLLNWCEYVLSGLKKEINKIDRLLDYNYLNQKILLPALDFALERKYITENEYKVLLVAAKKQVIQAGDLKSLFPNKLPAEISRIIRRLREKRMLQPENRNTRKYILKFENNFLLRGIIEMLDKENFLPIPINE
ncbi:MAG: Fic family protein [Ignavibacteria bacterium]|nr:Fic family protein [Ignavibacteria bacterium]